MTAGTPTGLKYLPAEAKSEVNPVSSAQGIFVTDFLSLDGRGLR